MLSEALFDFFKQNPSLETQSAYAIAISGGPDSMALADALIKNFPDKKFHLLSVDHGLRDGSQEEAKKAGHFFLAQDDIKKGNLTHHVLYWDGEKPQKAVMEKARNARYGLMGSYCEKAGLKTLFVAHHQDDQAETFLIRLAKGSGLDGLTGMRAVTKKDNIIIARPFLSLSKENLVSYCQQNKIDYIKDPSNKSLEYLRPRLRKSMAVLEEEGLSTKRLSITAKRLQRAQSALSFYTGAAQKDMILEKKQGEIILDFKKFQSVPHEISFRILQNLIETLREGYDYQVRMEKLEDLFESLMYESGSFKPRTLGKCRFVVQKNYLVIEKEKR